MVPTTSQRLKGQPPPLHTTAHREVSEYARCCTAAALSTADHAGGCPISRRSPAPCSTLNHMHYSLCLSTLVILAGCSLHDQIENTADSWHGQTLSEVQGAWGAPSLATTDQGWTTWRLGNDDGGWIVKFHINASEHTIDKQHVTTWGTLPSDLPHELAPKHHTF